MGEQPLPDEVARAARAYLAALVSPSSRADAWHDLLAEVRYWQDDELVPVLRLAHQVVGQHERVTDEAAAHALIDVASVEVDDLAAVLGASIDTARNLRESVNRARASGERAHGRPGSGRDSGEGAQVPDRRATPPGQAQATATEPRGVVDPAPLTAIAPTEPSSTQGSTRAAAPALRIGFDEEGAVDTHTSDDAEDDASDDWGGEPSAGLLSYRRLVGIAVIVWVLVVIAWLLGGS